MKKDKKVSFTTTGQGTTKQIQGVKKQEMPASSLPQYSALNQTQQAAADEQSLEFMSKSQAYDYQNQNFRNMTLNGTITTENGGRSNKGSQNFDKESFMKAHDSTNNVIVNPEKRVKKLLLQLIDLYTEVFDPSIFSEVQQKIIKTDAIPKLKVKLLKLR